MKSIVVSALHLCLNKPSSSQRLFKAGSGELIISRHRQLGTLIPNREILGPRSPNDSWYLSKLNPGLSHFETKEKAVERQVKI